MSVYIHPTAMKLASVAKLQRETGRIAVVTGRKVQLIERPTPKRTPQHFIDPNWPTGGNAA